MVKTHEAVNGLLTRSLRTSKEHSISHELANHYCTQKIIQTKIQEKVSTTNKLSVSSHREHDCLPLLFLPIALYLVETPLSLL
jgi:hypothetical protein